MQSHCLCHVTKQDQICWNVNQIEYQTDSKGAICEEIYSSYADFFYQATLRAIEIPCNDMSPNLKYPYTMPSVQSIFCLQMTFFSSFVDKQIGLTREMLLIGAV